MKPEVIVSPEVGRKVCVTVKGTQKGMEGFPMSVLENMLVSLFWEIRTACPGPHGLNGWATHVRLPVILYGICLNYKLTGQGQTVLIIQY